MEQPDIQEALILVLSELNRLETNTSPMSIDEFCDIIYKKVPPKLFKTAYGILEEHSLVRMIAPAAHKLIGGIYITDMGVLELFKMQKPMELKDLLANKRIIEGQLKQAEDIYEVQLSLAKRNEKNILAFQMKAVDLKKAQLRQFEDAIEVHRLTNISLTSTTNNYITGENVHIGDNYGDYKQTSTSQKMEAGRIVLTGSSDNEIIDAVLLFLNRDGNFTLRNLVMIPADRKRNIHDKLFLYELIERTRTLTSDADNIAISKEGKGIMIEHGSYSKYIQFKEQKEKREEERRELERKRLELEIESLKAKPTNELKSTNIHIGDNFGSYSQSANASNNNPTPSKEVWWVQGWWKIVVPLTIALIAGFVKYKYMN